MLWRLRFEQGNVVDLPLGTSLLGRGDRSAIRVAHPSVSREHLRLHVGLDAVVVEDLESSGGTFIDRARLEGSRAISDAVALRAGHVDMILTPVADADFAPTGADRCPICGGLREDDGCAFCLGKTLPRQRQSQTTRKMEPLGLLVEIAHHEIDAGHLHEAEGLLARVAEGAEHLSGASPSLWQALVRCTASHAMATDDARWFQWVMDQLAACNEPPREVVAEVEQLPPALLTDVLPSLEELFARIWEGDGDRLTMPYSRISDAGAEASSQRSLDAAQ